MRLFMAGSWRDSSVRVDVLNPLTGAVIDTAPVADAAMVTEAVGAAEAGASAMRRLSTHERAGLLERIAVAVEEAAEELARTITAEEGKPITEARGESARSPGIFRLAAAELLRSPGEVLPIDAAPGAGDKFGFTIRQPCGVVVAITPFNYPLILVVHKIAPALAAGNAVILKPASKTPLTALMLTRLIVEAGVPDGAFQCLTGPGEDVGQALAADPRVRKISFTGSTAAGAALTRVAGVKRLSLELGGNAPLVVMPDADLDLVARSTAVGGYTNAGQACISPQRVITVGSVTGPFLERLVPLVAAIRIGDPLDASTQLSAMVSTGAAEHVEAVIRAAADAGAEVLTGGERDGAVLTPSVVVGVRPGMAMYRDELFGPAVAVIQAEDEAEAVRLANDTQYGLSAAVFTRDINRALNFAKWVDAGNIHINWNPLWRVDLMPYGGLKASGFGKEGPRYAIEEMSELKTVVIHGLNTDAAG
jgi:acyl-CoA reductase-like NAD-dependent aldehyde dehydrogenase